MASRSRLFTRFNTNRTLPKTTLVIFDVDISRSQMMNSNIEVKSFTADEIDAWFDHVTSGTGNMYLFMSNVIMHSLMELICESPQIDHVYVFCKHREYRNDPYRQPKVRGTFDDSANMYLQFEKDITPIIDHFYSEESTFTNIDPKSAETLWWRMFYQMLQCIVCTDIAKDELAVFAQQYYSDNNHQLRNIDEFQKNYQSDQVIYWYTRQSFLHNLTNRILRNKKNINNIFKLRLFVKDLISGLRTAQLDIDDLGVDRLVAYRGQSMRTEELQKLQRAVRQSFLVNSFFSSSLDRNVASLFAQANSGLPNLHSVLLTIEANADNISNNTVPFANISSSSFFEDEQEVLFSMHSTFLVQSVQLGEDDIWNIHLKLTNNEWDIDFGQRSIFTPHADQIFIRHLSKENKQFIAFQVLLDMILRLDQTRFAREELLEFCRSKYQDDPVEQQKIDDFDANYRSEDAAGWYTKDSFLYRILNESLRIETVDYIVKMRYFINDLHNQLAELQTSFIASLNGKEMITLYRGQPMKVKELKEIAKNTGGFISMNSFMSATQDRHIALVFSGNGVTSEEDEVSVIYEMVIDTNIRSTPYAKIESMMQDEEEVLFSMGSVYRIGEVQELEHRLYCVQLTMVYKEDQLWNKLTAHLNR